MRPSCARRDGNIITGGGVTAGMDFALAAIAEIFGQAVAEDVQLALEYASLAEGLRKGGRS